MLAALGFGHIEIGSVSAGPSEGNPKPRLWRLPGDRGLIVNYGLPNDGADVVAERLARSHAPVPTGVNIVNTNRGAPAGPSDEDAMIADYIRSMRRLDAHAAYLMLNLSCPNTRTDAPSFPTRAASACYWRPSATLPVQTGIPQSRTFRRYAFPGSFPGTGGRFAVDPGIRHQPCAGHAPECRRGPFPARHAANGWTARRRKYIAGWIGSAMRLIATGGVFSAADAYLKIRQGGLVQS